MSKQRLAALFASGYKQLNDPYYQGFAAQVAFYLLLSVIPTIILLSQILGVFSISIEILKTWIAGYVTGEAAEMILGLFDYVPSGAVSAAFVVVALWSASRAQFAMLRITNYTFSAGSTTGMGYLRERIRAVITMVITLFTVTFALLVLVYGQAILAVLLSTILKNAQILEYINEFWNVIRWPSATAMYFLMVSFNYYVLPTKRVRFRTILPGSIVASAGMLIMTGLFSLYLESIANYDIIYGSLASIVALLFWLYLIGWVLGLGIIFNKAWADTKNEFLKKK